MTFEWNDLLTNEEYEALMQMELCDRDVMMQYIWDIHLQEQEQEEDNDF